MILEVHWFTENQKAVWELVSSIATALAAIATFVTVREMRKSRKDSLTPDLYIEQSSIVFESSDDRFFFFKEEHCFNLYNLGNGPAKDIKVIWENDIISRIKKLGFKETPKKGTDHLYIKYGDIDFLFNKLSGEAESNLNFVLGREKAIDGFFISSNSMELLQLESMYRFDQINDRIVTLKIQPENNSVVRIEYLDPLNKKKVIQFSVITNVTIFRKDKSNKLDSIRYDFHFRKV